jgi:hypothetical protein
LVQRIGSVSNEVTVEAHFSKLRERGLQGVRQVDPISTLLFSLVLDTVITNLEV